MLLQWKDFAGVNAAPILDRYRHELLSFNEDIQGTVAVAVGAIEAAAKAAGSTLAALRVCIVGAGSAGTGIAHMLRDSLSASTTTVGDEAIEPDRLMLVDRHGLLHDRRRDLNELQRPLAMPYWAIDTWANDDGATDLATVMAELQPTVLFGVSGVGGLFTEQPAGVTLPLGPAKPGADRRPQVRSGGRRDR